MKQSKTHFGSIRDRTSDVTQLNTANKNSLNELIEKLLALRQDEGDSLEHAYDCRKD